MDRRERRNKFFLFFGIGVLFCCTVIAIYGIINSPDSDEDELEQELTRNEQMLNQNNNDTATDSAAPETKAASSSAAEPQTTDEPEETISVIGDSVFLGAAPAFQEQKKNAVIDAKISRQVYHGLDVAKKLNKKKKLGNTVIISLGTNSKFNPVTGQELIDYLGSERTIYWINAYGKKLDFQKEVNKTIDNLAKKNPNVHVIYWDKEAKKHPNWFYQDGTHLNTKGQKGFSDFVIREMEKALNR